MVRDTAKLTIDGNNQVIVLPEKFQLSGNEVYIKQVRNAIVLISKDHPWQPLFDSLDHFSNDFMETREQPSLQTREELL
ncbi:MAG: AbrB/MazE/SpoVT family DNA-binding domain-containing protein [Leptolyngbyaceae cyanobacterium CSU_1_3]|nr:AbrB/MazE/SpoVT family DNA-binding domain-containing protein [Leptolyngbyaceae cyanobacterium CSU_1_3]